MIQYLCSECDIDDSGSVQVTFTSADGNRYDFTVNESGVVDFTEIVNGNYEVEMYDANGDTIMWYELDIEGDSEPEQPDEPTEPTEPDEPSEPEQPDEPTEPNEPDEPNNPDNKPDETGEDKGGNAGLLIGSLIALVVLAGGGTALIIFIKKKNKKNKGE